LIPSIDTGAVIPNVEVRLRSTATNQTRPVKSDERRVSRRRFNVTNTPPLGTPNTVLGTPEFGSITSAGDPRVIQLAVKVNF